MVLLLPITSMPLIVQLAHSSSVAAPSGLALLFMVIIWLFFYVIKGGIFPAQMTPLFGFVTIAILATLVAPFFPIPAFKDVSVFRQGVQGLFTLGIGICFYLVAATYPTKNKDIELTLRLINWSGLVILCWSLVQVIIWYRLNDYPEWINNIQGILSIADLFRYQQRATGFSAEPSWLAHQLNMLYLPFWLASSLQQFTVHRFRIVKMTFENFLLAIGIIILWLTLSRSGLIAFLLMIAYLIVKINMWLKTKLQRYILQRWQRNENKTTVQSKQILVSVGLFIILVFFYLAILFGVVYGLSLFDPRMKNVFDFDLSLDNSILRYGSELRLESRLVYWFAGWDIFNDHPWLGVGLGNTGYYFPEKITSYGWNFMEVREVMYRYANIINVKSLWIRLLAETGITGFAFFMTWWCLLWRTSRVLEKSLSKMQRMVGFAGIFVLLGLIVEGFSIDSFALPYFWFSLGLVTVVFTRKIGLINNQIR